MKSKKLFFFSLILFGFGLTTFGLSLIISDLGLKTCSIPTDKDLTVHSSSLVDLTNAERIKEGLAPLRENKTLSCIAFERAKQILKDNDFSHNMTYLAEEAPLAFDLMGENMAKGIDDEKEIIYRWIASPKHKENILSSRFNRIGVVVVKEEFEGKESIIVIQVFGEKLGLFELAF